MNLALDAEHQTPVVSSTPDSSEIDSAHYILRPARRGGYMPGNGVVHRPPKADREGRTQSLPGSGSRGTRWSGPPQRPHLLICWPGPQKNWCWS